MALWCQKGEKDMVDLCLDLDAMIWEYATNMFVKHDVEQVQGQGKHQCTSFGLAWSKPKRDCWIKDWRLED